MSGVLLRSGRPAGCRSSGPGGTAAGCAASRRERRRPAAWATGVGVADDLGRDLAATVAATARARRRRRGDCRAPWRARSAWRALDSSPGVLPRENGLAFSGFGALLARRAAAIESDGSAGRFGGAIRSIRGAMCTNRTWSSLRRLDRLRRASRTARSAPNETSASTSTECSDERDSTPSRRDDRGRERAACPAGSPRDPGTSSTSQTVYRPASRPSGTGRRSV